MKYQKYLDKVQLYEKKLSLCSSDDDVLKTLLSLVRGTFDLGMFDKCRIYSEKALQIAENSLKNRSLLPYLYYALGYSYYHVGMYEKSLKILFDQESLPIRKNSMQYKGLGYMVTGLSYAKMKDFEKAMQYFHRSMDIGISIKNRYVIARAYNGIYIGFSEQGLFSKGIEPLEQGLAISEEISDDELMSVFHNNLGYTYRQLKQYHTSLEYLFKCLYLREMTGNVYGLAVVLYNVGYVYFCLKDTAKALDYYEKALAYAHMAADCSILELIYHGFADLYEVSGDIQKALEYYKRYSENHEQVYNNERARKFAELQASYELEKKDREAEIYRLKNIELVDVYTKMEQQNKELYNTNQSKDYILNIVSHDLKNSVGAIVSIMDMIPQQQDPIVKRCLSMISGSAEKSLDLVKSILTASKIELEDFKLDLSPFVMQHFFAEHHEHLRLMAGAKNLNFTLSMPARAVLCAINPGRFWEIISNIFSNAVKFTQKNGHISITGRITSTKKNSYFTITTTDTGIGIAKHNLPQIFDKFTPARRTGTDGEPTTGLGLSIVKRLVTLHHGALIVKSEENVGTKVIVKIPLVH